MVTTTHKRLLTDEEMAPIIAAGNEAQLDYVANGFKRTDPTDYWVKQAQLEAEVRAEQGVATEYDEGQVAYRAIARESHAKEAHQAALLGLPVAPKK